jgi:hypothetical protein
VGGQGRADRCAEFVSRTTARKVTATVAVVAAWAALTGLGTYGRFENEVPGADRLGAACSAQGEVWASMSHGCRTSPVRRAPAAGRS